MENTIDHVSATIADLTISAELVKRGPDPSTGIYEYVWKGTSTDTFKNVSHPFTLSSEDFGTLLCAFVQGVDTGWLYVAAAKIVADWPRECRPVP